MASTQLVTLKSIAKVQVSLFGDTDVWIQIFNEHLHLVLPKYLKLKISKMEDSVIYPHPHLFV